MILSSFFILTLDGTYQHSPSFQKDAYLIHPCPDIAEEKAITSLSHPKKIDLTHPHQSNPLIAS